MTMEDGRAPSGQALVSDQARAGLDPAGFDPSRIPQIIARLSRARLRNLLALPLTPTVWLSISEMRPDGATGSGMSALRAMEHPRLCERRWAWWGGEVGQARGAGYEYCLTDLGRAVRTAIAIEAAAAGETQSGSTATAKARANGIAHLIPHSNPKEGA